MLSLSISLLRAASSFSSLPSSTLYTLNHSQGLFRIGEWSGAQLSFRSQPGNPHPLVTLPDCLLFPFFHVSLSHLPRPTRHSSSCLSFSSLPSSSPTCNWLFSLFTTCCQLWTYTFTPLYKENSLNLLSPFHSLVVFLLLFVSSLHQLMCESVFHHNSNNKKQQQLDSSIV